MALESASYVSGLNSSNPDNLDGKNQGDDHLRMIKAVLLSTFPGSAGAINRVQTKSGTYAPVVDDTRTLIRATGALALNLAAAATYGNGWSCALVASAGDLTVTPNGAELLNGVNSALVMRQGQAGFLWCDGSGMYLFTQDAPTASSTTSDITGNETLTVSDHSRIRKITASADVTLPASPRVNGTIRLKSYSTGNVRVLRNSGQTIDGAAADYRLPAYEFVELTYIGSNDWIVTRRPGSFVGEVRAMCNATPELGWAAIGTAVSRTTCAGLFAVCGTTYGAGDGSTTFDPPDGRGRVLVGAGTGTQVLVTTGATASGNAVPIASNDAWHTGMQVATTNVSGFTGGLSNSTYYIRRISATSVKFYTTLAAALQDGTPVTISGTGNVTMTHTLTARAAGEKFGHEARGQHGTEVGAHLHTDIFTNPGGGGVSYDGNGGGSDLQVTSANAPTETMSTKPPSLGIPMMVKL